MAATLTIAAPRRAGIDEDYLFEASEAGLKPGAPTPQLVEVITPEGVDRLLYRATVKNTAGEVLAWRYRAAGSCGPSLTLLND